MVTDHLADLVSASVSKVLGSAAAAGSGSIEFERPKRKEHGDWSSNIALTLGREHGSPRDVAEKLARELPASDVVERVEVAGPGFLNFYLSPAFFHDVVRRAADASSSFGRSNEPAERVNVEYVSANPSGPINVVSGRHAAVGDSIANLLEATGNEVTREFYVNDAGRQMDLFGQSLAARYLELHGLEASIPEGGYQGDYLKEVAAGIAEEHGKSLVDLPGEERVRRFKEIGIGKMLDWMKSTLERFGVRYDVWFRESSMHESGAVKETIAEMKGKDLIEEREGALWFRSSEFGDDKDRVIVKANGDTTYLASDIPYLKDKFARGFDRLIYLWGADHHGTIGRMKAAITALGYDKNKVEIPLVQIVTLMSGTTAVKASKRAGVLVPLDELIDEVGVDAARYTFLTRSIDAPLEFDIDLVKEQAPENPVYYVQYAHARISSILRRAEEEKASFDPKVAPLESLTHMSEDDLMRKIASYEFVVPEAADFRAPQRIARYVEELASEFSAFYRDCKVMTDDKELTSARLSLCLATRRVIADGLGLLGVGAPERM